MPRYGAWNFRRENAAAVYPYFESEPLDINRSKSISMQNPARNKRYKRCSIDKERSAKPTADMADSCYARIRNNTNLSSGEGDRLAITAALG